jgi:3-dehydroquinate synthase
LTEVLALIENFAVSSFRGKYDVAFKSWADALTNELTAGDVVIVDRNVADLYPSILPLIKNNKTIFINACEDSKSYIQIGQTIEEIISSGFSKNNRLIAIGGGITQDITSFSSSIMFRGVDWIFFPTNLLTQCDSCIGSKTSVNLGQYKNQLGGFHPPRKIFIDMSFCDTLDIKEICSGLGEMMHYFLVDGNIEPVTFIDTIKKAKNDITTLQGLVWKSLSIKKKMIELDEFDQGPRNVFNYGHTFGHALEAVTKFAVPHGIAVAYGIDLANIISAKKGLIDMSLRNEIRLILEEVWSSMPIPEFDTDIYFSALKRDKKNIGSEVKVILTRGLGDMFITTLDLNDEAHLIIGEYFEQQLYGVNL